MPSLSEALLAIMLRSKRTAVPASMYSMEIKAQFLSHDIITIQKTLLKKSLIVIAVSYHPVAGL
ncbi:MAG: hypothetical protein HZB61_03805 [Nitrospirae bacterium]|nr:hypothetical protein [Nitrospirota bacterium]